MKVKDLIRKLNEFDGEMEVIKAKDDEGNGFHVVDSISGSYVADLSNYHIDEIKINPKFLNDPDYSAYDEEDFGDEDGEMVPVIVL